MMNRRQFLATSAAAALVPPEMPRPMVGLYSMLTPDQKAAALNVAWHESFGPAIYMRRDTLDTLRQIAGPFASGRSERASEAMLREAMAEEVQRLQELPLWGTGEDASEGFPRLRSRGLV